MSQKTLEQMPETPEVERGGANTSPARESHDQGDETEPEDDPAEGPDDEPDDDPDDGEYDRILRENEKRIEERLLEGHAERMQLAFEQGIEGGRQEELARLRKSLLTWLEERFQTIPLAVQGAVQGAPLDLLGAWMLRVNTAKTLGDVFNLGGMPS